MWYESPFVEKPRLNQSDKKHQVEGVPRKLGVIKLIVAKCFFSGVLFETKASNDWFQLYLAIKKIVT